MIEFRVLGLPIPQGSTKSFPYRGKDGRLRVATTSTSRNLKDWRNAIAWEAQREAQRQTAVILAGPVSIELAFTFPRPKSLPKRIQDHIRRPDLDKCIRAVLDAITHVLIVDDSQIVNIVARKAYGNPGVHVRLNNSSALANVRPNDSEDFEPYDRDPKAKIPDSG